MANQYSAGTPAKIQTLLNAIRTALTVDGVPMDIDFKDSVGMRLTLSVSNDGKSVTIETMPSDQGQSNRFGPIGADGVRLSPAKAKIILITSLP